MGLEFKRFGMRVCGAPLFGVSYLGVRFAGLGIRIEFLRGFDRVRGGSLERDCRSWNTWNAFCAGKHIILKQHSLSLSHLLAILGCLTTPKKVAMNCHNLPSHAGLSAA